VHEAKVHDVIYDEDFKKLWDKGISIFDGFRNETFDLRAMLFCTINDFLVYENLSGYSVKGIVHAPFVKKTQATYN